MGIFSFFKSKKPIELEREVEKISFEDIGKWLENKDKVLRKDERGIFEGLGGKLEEFYVSVEAKLGVLEGIDIESKKEHGRAKILVRQGLDNYINSVRVLLKDLGAIGKEELGKFAVEIGKVFGNFEKTSAIFYGRANYLVGDEMVAVRNEVRRFYNGLVEMFEGPLIKDLKKVGDVRLKLDEFSVVRKSMDDVEEGILSRDKKIDEAKGKAKRLEGEVEEIKNSAEYASGIKARDEIGKLRIGLDREIGKLKELIDFKRLTSLVHSNEREFGIVKDYRAHFVVEFSKDNGERLFGLMEGSNMKSSEIEAQVDLIEKKRWELVKKHEGVGVDYSVGKLKEIEDVEEERESIELENVKADRRLGELKLRLKGLRNEVVGLVEKFGVVVGND